MIWFIILIVWTTMWYFANRGTHLIDPKGRIDAGDVAITIMSFLFAPIAFAVMLFDGHNDLREVFFLGKSKPKTYPRPYEKPLKAFFGVKEK